MGPRQVTRAKVIDFFSGQSTKASPPPVLVVKRTATNFKKMYFSLSGQPLTPSPLLVDCSLKKNLFSASLRHPVYKAPFYMQSSQEIRTKRNL